MPRILENTISKKIFMLKGTALAQMPTFAIIKSQNPYFNLLL